MDARLADLPVAGAGRCDFDPAELAVPSGHEEEGIALHIKVAALRNGDVFCQKIRKKGEKFLIGKAVGNIRGGEVYHARKDGDDLPPRQKWGGKPSVSKRVSKSMK